MLASKASKAFLLVESPTEMEKMAPVLVEKGFKLAQQSQYGYHITQEQMKIVQQAHVDESKPFPGHDHHHHHQHHGEGKSEHAKYANPADNPDGCDIVAVLHYYKRDPSA